MKWLPLAVRFPKWAVAAAIIGISSAIFFSWLIMRGSSSAKSAVAAVRPGAATVAFKPEEVVLCGNTLVNFRSGEVIAREWLEGFGDAMPPIAGIFPAEELVIAARGGNALAYGFDGKAKPQLVADGKPIGPAAFSNERPEAIFVRDGDLWKGRIDWVASAVSEAKRITDTGYFRGNLFTGEWFWIGDEIYVSVLGRPHLVTLADGKVAPQQVPLGRIARGASKDQRLTAVGLPGGRFGVAEFGTSDLRMFSTIGEVKQVLWLTPDRVAVLGGYRLLSIYDHSKRKVIHSIEGKSQITAITAPSPDGGHLLLGSRDGISMLDVDSEKIVPLKNSIMSGDWVSNDSLLCSVSDADSESRGVWLLQTDGSCQRISNQPMDSSPARGQSEPVLAVKDGALFVSGGNLWHFATVDRSLRQLTREQKLSPNLKLLKDR